MGDGVRVTVKSVFSHTHTHTHTHRHTQTHTLGEREREKQKERDRNRRKEGGSEERKKRFHPLRRESSGRFLACVRVSVCVCVYVCVCVCLCLSLVAWRLRCSARPPGAFTS